MRVRYRLLLCIISLLVLASTACANPLSTRQPYHGQAAEFVMPPAQALRRPLPVIVILPWTGGTAREVYEGLRPMIDRFDAVVVLPRGRFERSHYSPNFMDFVDHTEQRILLDLDRLAKRIPIDRRRIVLAGHSLGGDLAWALSARNPDRFAGAVMAGTRTSHPIEARALRRMRVRGFRAAFVLGRRESVDRRTGMTTTRRTLKEAKIHARLRFMEDLGHELGPKGAFINDLAWVLGHPSYQDPSALL